MLWWDPDRWVDSDVSREAWGKLGCFILIVATLITTTAIFLGIHFFR